MLFRTIVSAFFLDASTDDGLATLVQRAGMTDVAELDELDRVGLGFHDPARQILGGTWGIFKETWAVDDYAEGLRVLQLYSPATRYLDAWGQARDFADAGGDTEGDDWPLSGYVTRFRDACIALAPRAAYLDTWQ